MTSPFRDGDPVATAAHDIVIKAQTAFMAYANNGDLTPDAIRQQIARVWVQASDDLRALQDQASDDNDARRQQLTAQAFGSAGVSGDPASLAMSARDAAERVAMIDGRDAFSARQMMAQAEMTGDELLARALAAKDYSDPFATWGVLDGFLAKRPSVARALGELANLATPSLQRAFVGMASFVLPVPPQLAGLDEWRIRALAAQASA